MVSHGTLGNREVTDQSDFFLCIMSYINSETGDVTIFLSVLNIAVIYLLLLEHIRHASLAAPLKRDAEDWNKLEVMGTEVRWCAGQSVVSQGRGRELYSYSLPVGEQKT